MAALRACIAVGVAAIWFALFAPPMFMAPQIAVVGAHFVDDGSLYPPNRISVTPRSAAYRAGLRTGDIVGCLSIRDRALFSPVAHALPQTPIVTCVQRSGRSVRIAFRPDAEPPDRAQFGYASDVAAALRLAVVVVFALVGITLVLLRPGLMTWLLYGYCLLNAPSIAAQRVWTILPSGVLSATGIVLPTLATAAGVVLLLLFALVVPSDDVPRGWRRGVFFSAIAVGIIDIAFMLDRSVDTSVHLRAGTAPSAVIDAALTLITVCVVIARLVTMERGERARFGWAAFAIIYGVVTNDLRNIFSFGSHRWIATTAAYLTVGMPLFLLYGILRRHVIDVRFVLSRTVVYAALTTLIVGVIGLVDWATSVYLHEARAAMAIDAAVTVAVAFALHRTYNWIEASVEFVLFRGKHDAQAYLARLARTLLRAKQETTVDHALVEAPYEKFDLTMTALFRADDGEFTPCVVCGGSGESARFDMDDELVRFLITERARVKIDDMRARVTARFDAFAHWPAIAIPLFQGDDLIAFAVYGIHRDGTKLDPDEVETLERLCETGAQAYTHIEVSRFRTERLQLPPLQPLEQ